MNISEHKLVPPNTPGNYISEAKQALQNSLNSRAQEQDYPVTNSSVSQNSYPTF